MLNRRQSDKRFLSNPIIIILLVLVCLLMLTWIVPSGCYERVTNENGQTIVAAGTFSVIEKRYISLLSLPKYIVQGINSVSTMLMMMFLASGSIQVVIESGAFQWIIDYARVKTGERIETMIISLTFLIGIMSLSASITGFIALTPLIVEVTMLMGYDAMLGAGILIVGTGVGFSCGALRPTTTAIAQTIAELPIYSGFGFRIFVFVVLMIGSDWVLIRYARKLKGKRQYEGNPEGEFEKRLKDLYVSQKRKILVLIGFLITIVVMAMGCIRLAWGMEELAALFIVQAFLVEILAGYDVNTAIMIYMKGLKNAVPVCLITGLAASTGLILQDAEILDTIVHLTEVALGKTPALLAAPIMFVVNFVINIFIGSGSGQAVAVMPVMIPVADMLHINRQVVVLAYNLGDGLCNYIMPTASVLIGPLGLANLSYIDWMKRMRPLFITWFVLAILIMMLAQLLQIT